MRRAVGVLAAAAACAVVAGTITAVVLAGGGPSAGAPPAATGASEPGIGTRYYLSLGDSLSQGIQPRPAGGETETSQGYSDQLYAVLRQRTPSLQLVKLGCSGETTSTMRRGGVCAYPGGSQLAAADSFLRSHRGQVSLITLDIGANDPNTCILDTNRLSTIPSCLATRLKTGLVNLSAILAQLRAAGGRKVMIIGMSYYVPELAGWLDGQDGQEIAVLSERLVRAYNRLLAARYARVGGRFANVFSAFHSGDFTDRVTLPELGPLPRNVATVCEWTWSCTPGPRGPDEHANTIGYGVIALAFLLARRR